jgi:hypothetical protein
MPARKWIQRRSMRKFELKSEGKLIWGARKVARAALAMRPPKISPVLRITEEGRCAYTRTQLPTPGLYTTAWRDGIEDTFRLGKKNRFPQVPG